MIRRVLSALFLALMLVGLQPTPADAFAIVPAIVGALGLAGTFAGTLVATVIEVGFAVGLSYLAKALAPKQSTPDITQLPGGTSGKLQAGAAVPRAFGVGTYATAGSLVYSNTYSPAQAQAAAGALGKTTAAAGGTPNAYLTQVIALSDLPVTGMTGLLVNGVAVTYNPAATASFEGIPIPEYNSGGADYLWVRFYDGTQVAADPQSVQLFGSDVDRPYGSARVGTGIAYAVATALVNDKLFSGFPQFKFVLQGVKLYDRRYDSSAGGTGTQRWADSSTWAFTANPVVAIENLMRGVSYAGKWLYGAQTVSNTQLPSASWMAAATECDSAISLNGGGSEPQFAIGGEISLDTQPADCIDELLKACNGRIAEIGGAYKVRAGAPGAAVMSFTDDDILSTDKQTFTPFPSLQQTINAVTAKYISQSQGWNAQDAVPLYDATLEAADGGRRQPVDINYSFVTSGTQVQRLMKAERDSERAFRRHALPMPPDGFVIEPLDVVSWTSTRNGYSAKLFDIISGDDLPNLNVAWQIKEIDPNAYDWTPATDQQPINNGSLVMLRPAPQPVVDWAAVPWTVHSDSGQDLAAIKLSWDPNSQDVAGISFEVRLTSSAEVIHRSYTDNYAAGSIIISQNMLFNTAYQVRGQYIPRSARETVWSSWLDVTTPDVRIGLDGLENRLRDFITTQFAIAMDVISRTLQNIAAAAGEQDAQNFLDKYGTKTILAQHASDIAAAEVSSTAAAKTYTDSAIASYETTVNASFDSTNANVTINASAVATLNGYAAAAYAVKLNVNGYVSGVQLVNGGSGSAYFQISADVFQVAWPGVTGGSPVAVFQVANVGGVAKLVFRGDMYGDGTITATAMNVGTLSAITANVGRLTAGKLADASTDAASHMIIDLAAGTISGYA